MKKKKRYCRDCGVLISNRCYKTYCGNSSTRCKKCQANRRVALDHARHQLNKTNKKGAFKKYRKNLGSNQLGAKAQKDKDYELYLIEKELKRIGLRRSTR